MISVSDRLVRGGLSLVLCLVLSACGPQPGGRSKAVPTSGPADLDVDKLNAQIDSQIGGLGTCVVFKETVSGREIYHYGDAQACMAQLPPCGVFDIANSLIGLDLGAITPATVYRWDGKPQPFGGWQTDADLGKAFKSQIGWWFQRLAGTVGHDRYVQELRTLDYGAHDPAGLSDAFWLGPQAGGFMTLTTGQQADFVRRFYAGDLRVKPDALQVVQTLTQDEVVPDPKGGAVAISGRAASCSSVVDGSRNVGWWVGRLKSPQRDLVFAASVEGVEAPPGREIERRMKDIFVEVGLLPS